MTRKRFIKLLMACGADRNSATCAADRVIGNGSYEMFYPSMSLLFRIRTAIRAAARMVLKVKKAMLEVGREAVKITSGVKSYGIEVTATSTGSECRVREWGNHGD